MKNILVITYWSFKDALVQTYTLPYVRIIGEYLPHGSKIYLLTLEKDHSVLKGKKFDEINSTVPEGVVWLPFAYHPFGIRAIVSWMMVMTKLFFMIFSKKISVIHPWATPAGAISYMLSVATGRKLVIDSYEPHAEAMVENGTWTRDSFAFNSSLLARTTSE